MEWNRRFAELMGEMSGFTQGLHNLLASNPALQEVMAALKAKEEELDGTLLRVSTSLAVVPDPDLLLLTVAQHWFEHASNP